MPDEITLDTIQDGLIRVERDGVVVSEHQREDKAISSGYRAKGFAPTSEVRIVRPDLRVEGDVTCPEVATEEPVDPEPEPLPSPSEAYPNRPWADGEATVVLDADGSVRETDGHAFGDPQFIEWYEDAPGGVERVVDATNPSGSGYALRFRYEDSGDGSYRAGTTVARSFDGGPFDELYIMFRIYQEPGGDWETLGHKFWYYGVAPESRNDNGSPVQGHITGGNGGPRVLGFYAGNNGGAQPTEWVASNDATPKGNESSPLVDGEWLNMEFLLVAESAPGAGDGELFVWVNDVLISHRTGRHWIEPDDPVTGFSGLTYYAKGDVAPDVASFARLGELHIEGR